MKKKEAVEGEVLTTLERTPAMLLPAGCALEDADAQKKWLDKAEKENWSVKDLREAVKGPKELPPADDGMTTFACNKCSAIVLAKDLDAAVKRLNGALDPGAEKIKASDLAEWPGEGEFVRFVVEF